MTVIWAALAAAATSSHACSRKTGSGDNAVVPGHRYPGTKHSGKQITSAPCRLASATADVARRTDSFGVAGTRMFARAMRTMLMPPLRFGVPLSSGKCVSSIGFLRPNDGHHHARGFDSTPVKNGPTSASRVCCGSRIVPCAVVVFEEAEVSQVFCILVVVDL
jgi:hypothetical protein